MNAEAIIAAMLASLGDPRDLVKRADSIEIPTVSNKAITIFKNKFGLLGMAKAHEQMIQFLKRLQLSIENAKVKPRNEEKEIDEAQYKTTSSFHLRNQTSFPASFGYTKSFGGVTYPPKKKKKKRTTREELEQQITSALELLNEELGHKFGDSIILANRGQFIINGEVVIDNHADVLKVLIMWMIDNRPEVLNSAVECITNMIEDGAIFK